MAKLCKLRDEENLILMSQPFALPADRLSRGYDSPAIEGHSNVQFSLMALRMESAALRYFTNVPACCTCHASGVLCPVSQCRGLGLMPG